MSLPDDLVREILLKLPSIKSALRLRCVCKSWRDLIMKDLGDELSNRMDNLGHKNEDPFMVFYKHESKGYYQMRTSTQTSQSFGRVNIPYDAFGMVGSCNGLVCLRQPGPLAKDYNLHLYNPVTREYRTLPFSIEPHCLYHHYHGFGFDTSSNDYKVISIHGSNNAEIYKLSTNRWRRLSNVDLKFAAEYDIMSSTCVYVNGFCYWRLYAGIYGGGPPGMILAFDCKTETFDHIKFPAENLRVNSFNDLGVLDNSLALCRLVNPDKSKKTINTEVWIMSEGNSWVKKFTINSVDLVRNGGACWVRGSSQAFQLNKGGEVIAFSTKEEEGKGHNAKKRLFRFDCTKDRAMVFKPSLVSIGTGRFTPLSRH